MQNDILIQKTGKNLVFGSALKGTLLKFWFLEVPFKKRVDDAFIFVKKCILPPNPVAAGYCPKEFVAAVRCHFAGVRAAEFFYQKNMELMS